MKRKQLARIDLSNPDKPKIIFNSVKAFNDDLKVFKDGQKIWIQVETYRKNRSLDQNRLMHAYLQEIADDTGSDMEEIKDVLKKKYLTTALTDENGELRCDKNGEVMEYVKDTSKLNTVEMMNFCEQIRIWAMEWGIYLEAPDEQKELKFNDYPQLNRENI